MGWRYTISTGVGRTLISTNSHYSAFVRIVNRHVMAFCAPRLASSLGGGDSQAFDEFVQLGFEHGELVLLSS